MPEITFYGAAQEVTGSCYLVETQSHFRLLMDCGMHQGGDDVERIKKDRFKFDPRDIDALVISHGHLDHSGLLPKLVHQGFDNPVYCTAATADLLGVLLRDSWGLYQRDLEWENVRRARHGRKPLDPEYEEQDVQRALALCVKTEFGNEVRLSEDVCAVFHDAGHILGSSIVELKISEAGATKRLVFSGDLGNSDSVLMKDPTVLTQADIVLMEGTYGDRNHRSMDETIEQLAAILSATWDRRGNVLIPSFAVGRTQEILYYLGLLHQQGRLDGWHVFLDSPMAIAVTGLYDRWIELLDRDDIKALGKGGKVSIEHYLPSLSFCQTPDESMAINKIQSGAIIIAGSGMCTGGRIRHHIKHRIWQERNTMIFIGYQAVGTLGRILVDGVKRIKLFRDQIVVKAEIETLGGFSAHAGQDQLIRWFGNFTNKPALVLIHGEQSSLEALSVKIKSVTGTRARIPEAGETFSF